MTSGTKGCQTVPRVVTPALTYLQHQLEPWRPRGTGADAHKHCLIGLWVSCTPNSLHNDSRSKFPKARGLWWSWMWLNSGLKPKQVRMTCSGRHCTLPCLVAARLDGVSVIQCRHHVFVGLCLISKDHAAPVA